MYPFVRPLLFALSTEKAHAVTLRGLRLAAPLARAGYGARVGAAPCQVMGLNFPNPVGLAAGLDKDGDCIDGLAALGFGFIEIGTVTPRPQPGNTHPRLFRLPEHGALINRMGFNNHGLDNLLANVAASRYRGVLGINIGKNFDTPIEQALEDYALCLSAVYAQASYVVVNISSPNTRGLRDLQTDTHLEGLVGSLRRQQLELAQQSGQYKPLVVKVAPDLTAEQVSAIATIFLKHGVDGVTVGNTTLSRDGVAGHPLASEAGGLSGAPLRPLSLDCIRAFARALDGRMPIIGVGGISRGEHARACIEAGASLVQLYTGLVYTGPGLVREAVQAIGEA